MVGFTEWPWRLLHHAGTVAFIRKGKRREEEREREREERKEEV